MQRFQGSVVPYPSKTDIIFGFPDMIGQYLINQHSFHDPNVAHKSDVIMECKMHVY